MKRILAAALSMLFIGWSPALAADGLGIGPMPWVGYGHDPLWSWDDGFFRDLKYRHDRYGYRPYRKHHPSGEVDVVNGEARYHYDRGYPYDHYDYGHGGFEREPAFYDRSAYVRCRTQWVWSDRDREDVPVRICS